MRISDWSSDECSSELVQVHHLAGKAVGGDTATIEQHQRRIGALPAQVGPGHAVVAARVGRRDAAVGGQAVRAVAGDVEELQQRSEEHTSELQSLMRISYAVFCLKKKKIKTAKHT